MNTKQLFEMQKVAVYKNQDDRNWPTQIVADRQAVMACYRFLKEGNKLDDAKNEVNYRENFGAGYEPSFYGNISPEEFCAGYYDKKLFQKEKEKVKNLRTQIEHKLEPVGRQRKRAMSEHDGEWIMERQWELSPFANTIRNTSGILPTLTITCDFSFRSSVYGKDIAKYGAFCWAIVDAVEAAGIPCAVNIQNTSSMAWANTTAYPKNTRTTISLKKAGEYISAESIAQCFTPAFYRRGIFVLKYLSGDAIGKHVDISLASSGVESRPVVSKGEIFLRREDTHLDPENVAKRILEALNHNQERE